jgi:hypothetical protein
LAFQKQVLTFQEFTVQQFKKQEEFNKNMDKHQPTWFTQ